MKRKNLFLLAGSTLVCASILTFFYKFITSKTSRNLVEYDKKSLILAHENRYTSEEINNLRNSFAKSIVFKEVLFEEDLQKGKYVNKLKDGSRRTYNNSSCKNASRENTIWIFGGSTTHGYACEFGQSSSWPDELFKLNKKFSYKNFSFNGADTDQQINILYRNIDKAPKIAVL